MMMMVVVVKTRWRRWDKTFSELTEPNFYLEDFEKNFEALPKRDFFLPRGSSSSLLAWSEAAGGVKEEGGVEERLATTGTAPTVVDSAIGRRDTDSFVVWVGGLGFGAVTGGEGGKENSLGTGG